MHPTTPPSAHTAKQVAALRKQALSYPETHEDFPWGHSAFKVKGKAFAFLHADADGFSISVKLPDSSALALHLPFAEPTGYGLGKSGWVTARFTNKDSAPLSVLSAWLEESFTAIAPKRLAASWIRAQAEPRVPTPRAESPRGESKTARAKASKRQKTRSTTRTSKAPTKERAVRAASSKKAPARSKRKS